ncbi:LamG-like jellyroll fold domain-containing protein [Paenibacillus sp. 2TAB26]|uniref:LamG-like jellyroll fold domain-containing protein n=1 Tax=Paenibacillus sp. 2TAB26 TaxID=3233005 RepID=UPI003F9CCFC9
MEQGRVMHIPQRQQPVNVLTHWIFDSVNTLSGSIEERNLVLNDVSGSGNHIKMVTTQDVLEQPDKVLLGWMEGSRDEAGLTFQNDRCNKGSGSYFQTVENAPINLDRLEHGYTIEAIVQLPEPFHEDKNSWMGVLTRQGRGADIGNSGENELLATLSVSNCKEYQWICHPTNRSSSVTSWSRYLNTGQWHHIAIVNDREQTLMYVNGICDYSSPSKSIVGVSGVEGKGWNIGASEWGGQLDQLFSGTIREIRIANEPLDRADWLKNISPQQVLQGTNEHVSLLQQETNYNFAFIPDAQKLVYLNPEMFEAQVDWIVNNELSSKIAMTAYVGDIVDHSDALEEWERSSSAISAMDQSRTPYLMTAGNHDYNEEDTYLNYFGPERFLSKDYYKGNSPSRYSSYGIVQAGSYHYLWLMVDMQHLMKDLAWCKIVLDEHSDMPTILVSHDILYTTGDSQNLISHESENGKIIWDELVAPYNQVFMTANGHYNGNFHQTRQNNSGHEVIQLLINYQDSYRGGNGWMRLAQFNENDNHICFQTYSPWVEMLGQSESLTYPDYRYLTGKYDSFTFSFDFKKRFSFVNNSLRLEME